jgi:hypothetical protein
MEGQRCGVTRAPVSSVGNAEHDFTLTWKIEGQGCDGTKQIVTPIRTMLVSIARQQRAVHGRGGLQRLPDESGAMLSRAAWMYVQGRDGRS